MLIREKLERCLTQLRGPSGDVLLRCSAERQLSRLLLDLVDTKVRYGLTSAGELDPLVEMVLEPALHLEGTAAILLDHLRYRLAHVAMRARRWQQAEQLLQRVLLVRHELRIAQVYLALCKSKSTVSDLDEDALMTMAQAVSLPSHKDAVATLDLGIQEPVTNLAELFLLMQGAPEPVIDALYDKDAPDPLKPRLTTGLSVLLVPEEGEPAREGIGRWLAQRQLDALKEQGWLVVDISCKHGDLGLGTPVIHPRGEPNRRDLVTILQLLAKQAPAPVKLQEIKKWFESPLPAGTGSVEGQRQEARASGNPVPVERASGAGVAGVNNRGAIDNDHGSWTLKPPYAVICNDSFKAWRHSLPNPQ